MSFNVGELKQYVYLDTATDVGDTDGGIAQTWTPLDPAQWWAAVERASVAKSERIFGNTVTGHANYIFNGRYHSGITLKTRLTWTDRGGVVHVGNVLDVVDDQGLGVETILLVSEIAP